MSQGIQSQPVSATNAAVKPKRRPQKAAAAHPKFIDMIVDAIGTLKDRNGSSRQAICKTIQAKYPSVNPDTMNGHVRRALKSGLQTGALTRPARSSATGATGRFKVGIVKPVKAAKKKAVKKPTKKRPAKKAGTAKPAAKPKASPKKKARAGKKKAGAKKSKPKTRKSSPKKKAKSTTTKAKKVAKKPKAKKTAKKPTKK